MTKNRLEFLSDGVFAIVMTLLIVEVLIPLVTKELKDSLDVESLMHLLPQVLAYMLSFAVLANFWTVHNFLFSIMSQNATRALASLNILMLSFISLIPFSTSFLGSYPDQSIAISFYSIHILIMALLFYLIREFIKYSPAIQNPELSEFGFTKKDGFYGTARIVLNVATAILAVVVSTFSTTLAIVLLLIPVIMGVIPGSLAFLLRITRLELLHKEQ